MNKVVLAYNGSLDSTLCIHWLKEHNDMEVVALVVDLGIDAELVDMADQAIQAGAASTHFEDLTDSFCNEFIRKALFAGLATVEGDPLATALGRPAICKALVETAIEIGADHIAHGCKPNSDDGIRFENCLATLAPQLKILQPLQEWNLKTKEQKITYARNHNLDIDTNELALDERSFDGNLWGNLLFRKSLDNTWNTSSDDTHKYTRTIKESSAEPETLIIEFKQGIPTTINNKKMSIKDIIITLNEVGRKHGVGYIDMIGHKIKGLKTRKVIECPGATILTHSHHALEYLTQDRELIEFKRNNIFAYRRLVRQGYWYTHYREILDSCFKQAQLYVTGEVKVELFHGQVRILGRRSPQALTVESSEVTGISPTRLLRPSNPIKKR